MGSEKVLENSYVGPGKVLDFFVSKRAGTLENWHLRYLWLGKCDETRAQVIIVLHCLQASSCGSVPPHPQFAANFAKSPPKFEGSNGPFYIYNICLKLSSSLFPISTPVSVMP